MATNTHRQIALTSLAQTYVGTVTTFVDGHVYTATVTEDTGETAAISYTVSSKASAIEVASAFVVAWAASLNPLISRITASNAGTATVTFTSKTAGRPFSIVLSATTGAWNGAAAGQANVGNGDYGVAANWSTSAVPTTGDDVVIPPGTVAIPYGLNQSTIDIGEFRVESGHTGSIGRFENGKACYLRLKPDELIYRGGALFAAINVGAEAIDALIQASRQALGAGLFSFYLLGSALDEVLIRTGLVGIAVQPGETASITDLIVSYLTNQQNDCDITLGAGLTLSSLDQQGGIIRAYGTITTATVKAGATLYGHETFDFTTLTVRGTAEIFGCAAAIGTIHCIGTVDMSKVAYDVTVAEVIEYPGGKFIGNEHVTITTKTPSPLLKGQFVTEWK